MTLYWPPAVAVRALHLEGRGPPGGFMSLGKKIISVAAGVALIAGVGAVAATPASAKTKAAIKGTTVLAVPLTTIGAAGQAGVTIAPIAPSRVQATSEVAAVTFPVSGPLKDGVVNHREHLDGVVNHRGGFSLSSATTGISLTLTKPDIEYDTSGGDTATLTIEINGVPDSSPFADRNGTRVDFLTITDFEIAGKWGKATKAGKQWRQTYMAKISGETELVDNDSIIFALSIFMGTPIFVAGLDFGAISSDYTITNTCETKKACSQR